MPKVERFSVKKEKLVKKQSLDGNCKILRTTLKPKSLSPDKSASWKGLYLFYNPLIIPETHGLYC